MTYEILFFVCLFCVRSLCASFVGCFRCCPLLQYILYLGIMRSSTTFVAALACAVNTASAWTWVAPSLIQPFNPSAPAGLTTAYQPLLNVIEGCVPFPAVDLVNGGRARLVMGHQHI